MKQISGGLALALACTSLGATERTELIGHFSNMVVSRSEDPHLESGYDLDLYARRDRPFGRLAVAIGSGEPALADLQDLRYDATSGKLSFKAAYSEGRDYGRDLPKEGREARRILRFSGTVSRRAVVGEAAIEDPYCQRCKPAVHKVIMKRTRETYVPDE